MRSTLVAIGITLLSAGPFIPQPQRGQLPLFNLMEALAKPLEQQQPWIREAGAKLKQSKVPTWGAAMGLVTSAYPYGGDAIPGVTGLFYLGRDVPNFGSKGDLVWEVRIGHSESITGMYWVSAATKSIKSLLPSAP